MLVVKYIVSDTFAQSSTLNLLNENLHITPTELFHSTVVSRSEQQQGFPYNCDTKVQLAVHCGLHLRQIHAKLTWKASKLNCFPDLMTI